MANPYQSQSAVNYNATPPSDDGSKTASNAVIWATIKTKLADPVLGLANAINSAVISAFNVLFFNAVSPQSANYTVAASDRGKLINVSNGSTVTLLTAASAQSGFAVTVKNTGTTAATVAPTGTDQIDLKNASLTLNPGDAFTFVSDGSGWWAGIGLNFVRWGVAGGTADALTVTNKPPIQGLVDGQLIAFRAAAANATTTPTLSPDGLGPYTITKLGGQALAVGDIAGNFGEYLSRYNLANTRLELLNPAKISVTSEPVNPQTGVSYTVVASDQAKLLTFTNAGAIAVTLPQATGSFGAGWWAEFVCLPGSVGSVTVTPTTSTIDGLTTLVLAPGNAARVVSDGTNYQVQRGTRPILHQQVFTASGTFTTPANTNTNTVFKFTVVGGGGGGGGGQTQQGSGGGAGATAIFWGSGLAAGNATTTVTVGGGGSAGVGAGNGGIGTASSIVFNATTVTANGGAGGLNAAGSGGGAGGTASNGTLNIQGGGGGAGFPTTSQGGTGGNSSLGAGANSPGNGVGGPTGGNYGGGGAGGGTGGSGGGGGGGVVIVEWVQ